jgi:hypothetical protein
MKNMIIIAILFPLMLFAQVNETWRASTFTLPGLGVLTKAELYRLQGVTSNVQTQINALVNDTAYDATSWNGVTTSAPSKNAVRDQIETLDAAVVHKTGNESIAGTKTLTGKLVASSTTNGNKPCPDMTDAQMLAVVGPSNGDCVFNTTKKSWYIYDSVGVKWKLSSGAGGVGSTDTLWVQNVDAASSSDFTTFTGWTVNTTTPLHGDQDLKVTHATVTTTYTVKETSIPVSQFFRGKNVTMQIAGKTTATLGNVKLTVRDETNGVDLSLSQNGNTAINANPSIPFVASGTYPQGDSVYYTFDIPATCALLSWKVDALPETGPPVTEIDDISFFITKLSLPTSALVKENDTTLRVDTYNGYGSTGTKVLRFLNLTESVGSGVTYSASSVNGDSFTIVSDSYCTATFEFDPGAINTYVGISLNATSAETSTDYISLPRAKRLTTFRSAGSANYTDTVSATRKFNAGDVLRAHTNALISNNTAYNSFTVSCHGNLNQAAVNKNSKIAIPTHEVRFEGSSGRGSTDTYIHKFDTITTLRGDAFTIVNDAVSGTVVTMTKKGLLTVSASGLLPTNNNYFISKNQSVKTTEPVASEIVAVMTTNAATGSFGATATRQLRVEAGDSFRFVGAANLTSYKGNTFHFTFMEEDISVGVTNILPQFSESDSMVRVHTANGWGSSNTAIRRFSNTPSNLGTSVLYADSATLGASFTILESGNYEISYTDVFGAAASFGISKNSTAATLLGSLSTNDILSFTTTGGAGVLTVASWSGYLTAGDVIRPHAASASLATHVNNVYSSFTISKTGKPNVTAVNVASFVSIPQVESQTIKVSQVASAFTNRNVEAEYNLATATVTKTGHSLIQEVDDSTNTRTKFVALKSCRVNVSWRAPAVAVGTALTIYKNGATYQFGPNLTTANYTTVAVANIDMVAGDYFSVGTEADMTNSAESTSLSINATTISDTTLSATETFNSDTATLTYAGSSSYTLSTLANAPVGTFITYTITGSTTDTAVQTNAAAPTQTTTSMNSNGIQIFNRVYASTSTSGSPAKIAIQIGKNMKGVSLNIYQSTAKSGAMGSTDLIQVGTSNQFGLFSKFYNESTGVLILDAGSVMTSSITANAFFFDLGTSQTTQTNGYITISASKNPALTGSGSSIVSARATTTSGQSIANSGDVLVQWDTASQINNGGGLITGTSTYAFYAPETGIYKVGAKLKWASALYAAGNIATIKVYKNGSLYSTIAEAAVDAAVTRTHALEGDDVVRLSKGDYVDIRISNSRTAGATSLSTTAGDNYVAIFKLGGIQ